MKEFLKFVHDDNCCKYYEAVYILFHTGMRISKFCKLQSVVFNVEKSVAMVYNKLLS